MQLTRRELLRGIVAAPLVVALPAEPLVFLEIAEAPYTPIARPEWLHTVYSKGFVITADDFGYDYLERGAKQLGQSIGCIRSEIMHQALTA
jgi:hypothetical protein